ncbi:hypothetical protein B0H13DRAFT_1900702 [Mycena leptocephala]|nr:hypothetical protein B0H13DRAFT_1900702 [Mycena leptocephala]
MSDADSPMLAANTSDHSNMQLVRVREDEQQPMPSKRKVVGGSLIDEAKSQAAYYKDRLQAQKEKERIDKTYNQQLRSDLNTMQLEIGKMNMHLETHTHNQRRLADQLTLEQHEKERLANNNQTLLEQLKAMHKQKEKQTATVEKLVDDAMAQQRQFYTELKSVAAEKERLAKKAQELERSMIEKANEAAALRAKVANQASGSTPRTRRGKIMSNVELRNISSRIPVLQFTPIAIPSTDPPSEDDSEDATPTIPGLNLHADGYARLAQEILKLAPGATLGVTSPKNKLRVTKETRCGVENTEQFVFKPTASEEEVQACEQGYLEVQPDDYRFYFGPGYLQARWNHVVLRKIVDAAMIEGRHLTPVPREWLLEQLTGQMKRAREAWARPQARGNETAAEGIARANQYREERAEAMRGDSAKSRKFANCEKIIEFIITLKTGTNTPDVPAWKRILEMLHHLGNDGMSSEEEFEEIRSGKKWSGYKVKICAWRTRQVDELLWMVDSMKPKLSKGVTGPPGPKVLPRERSDEMSLSAAPKGLPECLYDAGWIARESKKSPVFYADLAVSKEAFYLLAVSADMVEYYEAGGNQGGQCHQRIHSLTIPHKWVSYTCYAIVTWQLEATGTLTNLSSPPSATWTYVLIWTSPSRQLHFRKSPALVLHAMLPLADIFVETLAALRFLGHERAGIRGEGFWKHSLPSCGTKHDFAEKGSPSVSQPALPARLGILPLSSRQKTKKRKSFCYRLPATTRSELCPPLHTHSAASPSNTQKHIPEGPRSAFVEMRKKKTTKVQRRRGDVLGLGLRKSTAGTDKTACETEEKERMPLVIILDEARRLLYPIQFFLIDPVPTHRCGLRTQHRNRGESTGTGAQTRPDWGARLQRATANLGEREVGDVLRTRTRPADRTRCDSLGGRCKTRSPESGQDASQRAKEENVLDAKGERVGEGVPKHVQSEFVDSGGETGTSSRTRAGGRSRGGLKRLPSELSGAMGTGVAQWAPAVITRAGGAFVPSARDGNPRGAAGAGNVEGEEAASLSRLPSEFQRAVGAGVAAARARGHCAATSSRVRAPGLRGAQRVWGTSRVRGRRPSDAVRGPGGAFGAEVVAAPADDGRHRNTYVLDSSHIAGGPTSRRRAGGLECLQSGFVGPAAVGMIDGGGKRIESGVVTSRHGRFFSIRDSRSSSRSLHFDQTSMPKIQQEPGRMERQHRRELAAITRIRDPIEQCLAHVATPCHKDHGGELYTLFRIVGVDKLEVKAGTRSIQCAGNSSTAIIVWGSNLYGVTKRLVHLTLRARGAAIVPYECPGCGVKHREFYLDSAAGGIDGVCEIVEFWLGALGQPINKTVIEPIE